MTQQMSDLVDQAIRSRHSVRAFTNQMVEVQTLKDILHVASRAPSGTNTQPWKVYVVTGKKRDEIVERVCHAQLELFQHPEKQHNTKKLSLIILKTGFHPILTVVAKMVGGCMDYSTFKRMKKVKWLNSNSVIFNFLMRLWAYFLQSIKSWALGLKWTLP